MSERMIDEMNKMAEPDFHEGKENKTNTTDQTTYWVLQETSSLYWVFCLHSQLPNTVFTVDTKTFDAALHYTKIARHLAMGIVWVHGVHNVQQNTLEEARKLWNDTHLRGAHLIYNCIKL